MLAALAFSLWTAVRGWDGVQWFGADEVAHGGMFVVTRWTACVFTLAALTLFMARLARERMGFLGHVRSWLPVRLFVYSVFAAVAFTSLAKAGGLFQGYFLLARFFFSSVLMVSLSLWILATLAPLPAPSRRAGRALRVLDVALANAAAALLLTEGALSVLAARSSSPFFWDPNSTRSTLARFRLEPHCPYFDFQANSMGYHDEEFFTAGEKDCVVALVCDSFGPGVVPFAYNFATVAERGLREELAGRFERVAVHNFGVACTGVPEYAYLLETEALGRNPHLAVVCVFVGNDVVEIRRENRSRRCCFQDWWLWTATRRVLAVRSAEVRGGRTLSHMPSYVPDYVHDSSLEPPTFPDEAFLAIETERLEVCNPERPATRKAFEAFFKGLDAIHDLAGDRLLVMAIPDEFQVNGGLYARVLARTEAPEAYDRDYPQRRIAEYCAERGIALLNPLPALREAQKEDRVYHLRNTHWNARGNRVAGESLAEEILRSFAPGGSE